MVRYWWQRLVRAGRQGCRLEKDLLAHEPFALMLLGGLEDIVQRHIVCGSAQQTVRTVVGVAQIDTDLFIDICSPIGGDERLERVANEDGEFVAVAGQALVALFPIHQVDTIKERTAKPLFRQCALLLAPFQTEEMTCLRLARRRPVSASNSAKAA